MRAVLGLCLLVSSAFAQATTDRLPPRTAKIVDEAVAQQMERQKAVGVAVGIVVDGRVAYIKGYGFEDRERKVPVTSKSMFRWASISKTLTAYVTMQLVQEGKLQLSDDVRKFVPEFPKKTARVTPRDLLCHQGGIVHYSNGRVIRTKRQYQTPNPFKDVVLALDTFKESPLIAPPGQKYSYSSHAYILLSAVVQRAGGQSFATQIQERIVKPLGLKTLQPDYQWKEIPHRAVGYRMRGGKVVRSTDTDVSWKLGGGGYISNIDDLAAYAAAVINGRLLKPKTQKQMWTPQKTRDGKVTPVGLGIFVDGKGAALRVAHSGSQEKTKTRLVAYPNRKSAVVVMSNSENVNPGDFSTAVYRALSMAR